MDSQDLEQDTKVLEVVCVSLALVFGIVSRFAGLPPLVGFLAAGFFLNIIKDSIGLPDSIVGTLEHLAHLGVLMLLFAVGLKLKFKQVLKAEVVGTSILHFAGTVILMVPVAYFIFKISWNESVLIGISLAFSSTVLAAKLLETKKELSVFHGRTSIGILIIQDLIALVVLAVWSGKMPNMYAVLLVGLPFYRNLLHKIVDLAGHGELMVLMSMLLSVVIGGASFTAMGLSSELGALVVGALLANHPRAEEIGQSLASLKELFLVCFFLGIGLSGLPTAEGFVFALAFTLLLPVKAALFFGVLVLFKLRSRTAFLSALTLTSYSEFGLIVAAVLLPEYIVDIAVTMALSYVVAAPLNRYSHQTFERYENFLNRFQLDSIHPDEQPTDLGGSDILIFGMGRTGSAAYRFFDEAGYKPAGLEADMYSAASHNKAGRKVFFADAEDSQFWRGIKLKGVKAAVLAMDDIQAKLFSVRMLKEMEFDGPIISHALHEDHKARIEEAGATHTYLTMAQAGVGLAESTIIALEEEPDSEKSSAA